MTSEQLVQRLAWKLNGGWKNYRLELSSRGWPGILLTEDELCETVTELSRLQEALAAAEAERDCALIREGNEKHRADIALRHMNTETHLREFAEDRLASLPALLAETRKKVLEEATAVADSLAASAGAACGSRDVDHVMQCAAREDMGREVAAAIRSLSADEAQP